MTSSHSRPPFLIGDPEVVAVSCQQYIVRRAHWRMDRHLGRENAASLAMDVWLWLVERRAADPNFLANPKSFRKAIGRKLFDAYETAVRDIDRWDETADVQKVVHASTGGGGVRRLTRPDELFAQGEAIWHVQRAIARLPFPMQRVIRLYDLEEWSVDEVAFELEMTPGAVRQLRHRAKARLRELLESFGGMKAA